MMFTKPANHMLTNHQKEASIYQNKIHDILAVSRIKEVKHGNTIKNSMILPHFVPSFYSRRHITTLLKFQATMLLQERNQAFQININVWVRKGIGLTELHITKNGSYVFNWNTLYSFRSFFF